MWFFISFHFAIEVRAGLVMQQRPMTIVNSWVSGKNLNFIFTTHPLWGYSGMQDCTLLSWNELILIYFSAMRASEDIFCVEYNFLDCSARWCWGRQWKRLTTMSPLLLILIFLSEKTRARSFRSLIFHTTCWCDRYHRRIYSAFSCLSTLNIGEISSRIHTRTMKQRAQCWWRGKISFFIIYDYLVLMEINFENTHTAAARGKGKQHNTT